MKINQVETQVGITKKNIRFYEAQGLLNPSRNLENSYRDYSQDDVADLQRIKLLRKLGFPLEDIRQMQQASLTVADGMARHLGTLHRQQENLEQAVEICQQLSATQVPLCQLDAQEILTHMEGLERKGATFQNRYTDDKRRTMVAPIVITAVVLVSMVGALWMLWYTMTAQPMPLAMALFGCLPMVAVIGVVLALRQRLAEIKQGELEQAKDY